MSWLSITDIMPILQELQDRVAALEAKQKAYDDTSVELGPAYLVVNELTDQQIGPGTVAPHNKYEGHLEHLISGWEP